MLTQEYPGRVAVLVHPDDLPEVHELLAVLERRRLSGPQMADSQTHDRQTGREELPPGWSRGEIERAYLESPRGMRLIFDGMMDDPDVVLDSEDLAGFLTHKPDADSVVVRGTMGAFANRCSLRYQKPKRSFPFEHWYVDGGFSRYRMSRAVADILRPLRRP
jgi:hypothetical protein